MNVTFSLLISLFFFLPGIVAYGAFTKKEFSLKWPPIRVFVTVVLSALFYQCVGLFVVSAFFSQFSYDFIFVLFAGTADQGYSDAILLLAEKFLQVIFYFLILSLLAWNFSGFLRWGIKKMNLHRKWNFLKGIENKWYYYFTEEPPKKKSKNIGKNTWYYRFIEIFKNDFEETFDLVQITASVNVINQCYLYSGYLKEYTINSDGELDLIILEKTERRIMNKEHQDKFIPIQGHNFVLSKKEITTLNIEFLNLDRLLKEHEKKKNVRP